MGIKGKIKTTVLSNLYRSYRIARWSNVSSLERAYSGDESGVVIFQMGKVGSSSIYESLKRIQLGRPIYHAHVLTPEQLAVTEELTKAHWEPHRNPMHLWHSLVLSKRLQQTPKHKWKVITLVRDPIARNISAFFQTKHLLSETDQHRLMNSTDAEELMELFLANFYAHDAPINWFDNELKPVFGVDVFDRTFPREAGYCIYEGKIADVLLIRLEDLGRCQIDAFREFLGIEHFEMQKTNVGKDKSYSQAYSRMLNSIGLPQSYLDKMYHSKCAQHFYGDDELAKFSRRWLKSTDTVSA